MRLANMQLVVLATVFLSASTLVQAETAVAPIAAAASKGTNPVVQLVGYVKDSLVRTVDGSKEMWSNHGRCNDIRSKQKDFREKLKSQWEMQEKDMSPQEMKKKLQKVNGGISYDEFVFLSKGKEDRGKLMNMVFLMWGAPRIFPYALMFYPDILPSPFAPLPNTAGRENKLEKLSRQRSHAVISTLLSLEQEAKAIPAIAKFNILGRKKQERNMIMIDNLSKSAGKIMATTGSKSGTGGAQDILKRLDPVLYKTDELTRGEKRLTPVPKAIVAGLMSAISGPAPLNGVMPNFMRRGNVFSHVQKVMETDNFLVSEKVDLDGLSTARLLEACNDRLIGGPDRSNEELRKDLADWLDLAVVRPTERIQETGEHFNENLARTALMSYFSVEATRDSRSTSYLPRLMFKENEENAKQKKR